MKTITQTTVNRWAAHLAAGGLRRWWLLGTLTRHRDQPAAAHLLAQCLQKSTPPALFHRAEKSLHRIISPPAIDAVIDCWLEDKAGETTRQVIEEKGWRHSEEARWFKFLTKRNRFDEYFVSQLAPLVNRPEIARMLAYPEAANANQATTAATASALRQISLPQAVDAVIDCWLEDKAGETARHVIEERAWHHSDEAQWLKFLTKRNRFDEYFVLQLKPMVNRSEVARMLAHPEAANADQTAVAAASAALCQISAQETVDAMIDYWLEDKVGETARQVIEEKGWRHSEEARWFKFLTKRNRFDEYFVSQLAPLVNRPEIARMLAYPEAANANQATTAATASALRQISAQETVDAVIDCQLEDKAGETSQEVIKEQGWRHSEEARWFLYLAATGRFDEYLAEDYEFQTLRPEFLAAPAILKARIREAMVTAGEVRMNGLFLAEKRAAELTVADAEALVHANIRNENWEALVGNLRWLPARQILYSVEAIISAKWRPNDPDQAALLTRLGEIAPLLAKSVPEGSVPLQLNPIYQKWLARGETKALAHKSPQELEAMLKDETDPPDQIAALGALRKQGQLDAATVNKAGLSEHWMVRWVAVHFGADLTKAMRVNDAGIEWFRRLSTLKDAEALWTAKPCEVTRDGLEALREHIARLSDPHTAGGLLLVEAICTHYTSHDIEVEEGAHVMIEEDSFELEG